MSHETPPSTDFFSPVVTRFRVPGVAVTLLRQDDRCRLPPHAHREAYFTFLISGAYEERLGSRRLEHRATSVVYHPPELEHRDAYGPGGGRILSLELDAARLERWGGPGAAASPPREVRGEGALRAAWALCRAVAGPDPPPPLAVEDHAARLAEQLGGGRREPERRPPPWLGRVVERLRAEYDDPPPMTELARESGVHPAHLSRSFRRHRGCSPTAFVQRLRVEHVWTRLAGEDAPPLAALALEAGFSDQPHCTRTFRRLVGTPPGAFRTEAAALAGRTPAPP